MAAQGLKRIVGISRGTSAIAFMALFIIILFSSSIPPVLLIAYAVAVALTLGLLLDSYRLGYAKFRLGAFAGVCVFAAFGFLVALGLI